MCKVKEGEAAVLDADFVNRSVVMVKELRSVYAVVHSLLTPKYTWEVMKNRLTPIEQE